MAIPAQQQAKVVKPGHNAGQLHSVDEKHSQRNLVLANIVEKSILQVLLFIGHVILTLLPAHRIPTIWFVRRIAIKFEIITGCANN